MTLTFLPPNAKTPLSARGASLAVRHITAGRDISCEIEWGIAGDILSGFFCDVSGSTDITIEEDELSLALLRQTIK